MDFIIRMQKWKSFITKELEGASRILRTGRILSSRPCPDRAIKGIGPARSARGDDWKVSTTKIDISI